MLSSDCTLGQYTVGPQWLELSWHIYLGVTHKGDQDVTRVTSYLIKLRVGRCLNLLLHRDSNKVRTSFKSLITCTIYII